MKNDLNDDYNGFAATEPPLLREQKRRLRQALLATKDRALPVDPLLGRAVCEKIAALPCFLRASALLLYYPVRGEIDPLPLAAIAEQNGVPVGFPVCDPKSKTLTFRSATANTQFEAGLYGIPVPPEDAPEPTIDERTVCLVPALGYDKNRYRIGHGGGYYDRFLADFPGKAVGMTFEDLILETVFPEPHDRAVDLLVTEKCVYTKETD